MSYNFNNNQGFTFSNETAPVLSKRKFAPISDYTFTKSSAYTFADDIIIITDPDYDYVYPVKFNLTCESVELAQLKAKLLATSVDVAAITSKIARSNAENAQHLYDRLCLIVNKNATLSTQKCITEENAKHLAKKVATSSKSNKLIKGHKCTSVDNAKSKARKVDIDTNVTHLVVENKASRVDIVSELNHLSKKICYTSALGYNAAHHVCSIIERAKDPRKGKSLISTLPVTPINPIPPMTITIPTKDSYITNYNIKIYVNGVDKTNAVGLLSFDAVLNAGSHSWAYTLAVAGDIPATLIKASDIITIDLGVSGYIFKMFVESKSKRIEFGKASVQIVGRGLTAELAAPSAQARNVTYGDELTIDQLYELQLPPSWSLTYSAITWVVPGFTYSVDNLTPAATILDLCDKSGNIVIPSKDSKSIIIRERYPVKPWLYSDSNVDYFIPESIVDSYEITESLIIDADSVFIHGTGAGAVASQVKVTGEAGTKPLPTASNELMTDANATRNLGGRLLAAAVDVPPITSITIKGLDSLPIILPSFCVKVAGVYGTVNGYHLSLQVSNDSIDSTTTLTIGETSNSVYTSFYDLIPQSPLILGTALNKDGANVRLSTLSGGTITATGENVVIGNKYFVKQGIIVGDAPTLVEIPLDV